MRMLVSLKLTVEHRIIPLLLLLGSLSSEWECAEAFQNNDNPLFSRATRRHRSQSFHRLSNLPDSVIDTINRGGIAQVDNFLSESEVSKIRSDAQLLFHDGHFITASLATNGKSAGAKDKTQFDIRRDRSVCPAYIPSKAQLAMHAGS
ncbi:MAG: hypothetical protein SGARI_006949 [Bacillariaceae sp.]